jgi:hypothetical protein
LKVRKPAPVSETKRQTIDIQKETDTVTSKFFNLSVKAGRINSQQVRIALAIGTLVLFVLGAGAPQMGGG